MNATDRKEFELIHNKIDDIKKDIDEMKHDMSMAHGKSEESLRFIKKTYSIRMRDYGLRQNRTPNIERTHRSGE